MTKHQLIGTADVARRLGCCEGTVRNLDAQLKPERLANGRRVYRTDSVERVAAERSRK